MSSVPSVSPVRARLAMIYPLSVVFGGFEHQCMQTCNALQSLGVSARLLDWYDAKDDFDVLHLFGAWSGWYDLCLYARNKYPIVISALGAPGRGHGLRVLASRLATWSSGLLRQQTGYGLIRQVLRMAACVICLNDFQRRFFLGFYDLPDGKVATIPNGVVDSRFSADPDLFKTRCGVSDYVLYVGNIVARKNPLWLAQVLKQCGRPGVFIGGTLNSEQDYAYGREFAAFVSTAPNLLWIKGLDYNDPVLDSAYAGARVFCLPSKEESQPLSAMEAMAAGVPVILADRPYAYQPPFESVARCDLRDPQSLARCLRAVLAAPDYYRTPLPNHYRWNAVAKEVLAIYTQVLDR